MEEYIANSKLIDSELIFFLNGTHVFDTTAIIKFIKTKRSEAVYKKFLKKLTFENLNNWYKLIEYIKNYKIIAKIN